ncbi:MAG: NADP-dependent malic enzyme [Candidatus Liptonbacteria bacterium]|nr:NADP-dependent malic enzyme [Candidatus Liptonbacteria bacterium]
MDAVYKKSLEFHKKHGGKLETRSKVPLKNADDLSLAYTPGVAEVARAISKNKNEVYDYTLKRNSVAVVSDGSAILGLGNLGSLAAIPVMEGKSILFKELAGIDAFPICLDTQDVDEIVRTVKNIAPVFGGINLEDISAPRCFEIEKRLKNELDIPVVHDDQWGTSIVVLAAIVNAIKLKGVKKESVKIVVNGAGAAGTAVAKILVYYGFPDITICDSRGIISRERKDLNESKIELAHLTNKSAGNLESAAKGSDILIGVSKADLFTSATIQGMNKKPIVLALANPIPEIMPDEALAAGAFIVATGRSGSINQVNNSLAFPGIFRGALDNKVKQVTMTMLVRAAENLAFCVTNPAPDKILPLPLDKTAVLAVARAIKN